MSMPPALQPVTHSAIHYPCDMNAHCNVVLTCAETGGEGCSCSSSCWKQVQKSRGRKRKMSGDLGLLADNEGATQLLKPFAPVEKPAVYGPHEADTRSMIPELRAAYLLDPMYGSHLCRQMHNTDYTL